MTPAIPEQYLARAGEIVNRNLALSDLRSFVAVAIMETEQKHLDARAGLTRQQLAALDFIETHRAEHRLFPTFTQICKALDLASKSGVHRLVHALIDCGALPDAPQRWQRKSGDVSTAHRNSVEA